MIRENRTKDSGPVAGDFEITGGLSTGKLFAGGIEIFLSGAICVEEVHVGPPP